MDVKEAVQAAKAYVAHIYADEPIANLGLEEVEFEEGSSVWAVTVGFSRHWETSGMVRVLAGTDRGPRTYKVVRIDEKSGAIQSVRHRDVVGSR